jgi:hypothetical protein
MASSRVQGLADSFSLMDGLPKAAELEAARDIAAIGKLALDAQKRLVPKDTRRLEQGLTLQTLIGQLRVRAGLFGIPARSRGALRASQRDGKARLNLGSLFYGIIVNFGRRAQTVIVQRRKVGARGLRNGRKRAEDIATTYSLPITPIGPREFIDVLDVDSSVDAQVSNRLATFWTRTLNDLGASE